MRFALPPAFVDAAGLCVLTLIALCSGVRGLFLPDVSTGSIEFEVAFSRVYFSGTLFAVMALYALSATRYAIQRRRGIRVRTWLGHKLVPWGQIRSIRQLPRLGFLSNVLILRLHFWGLTRWFDNVPFPKCIVLHLPRAEHACVIALWSARRRA